MFQVGHTSSLFSILHLYLLGEVKASEIVSKGYELGYNYLQTESVVTLINNLANTSYVYDPTPALELTLTNQEGSYKSYYWPHRIQGSADNWYNMGQTLESHIASIASAGYKSVASLRSNGEATLRLSTDPSVGPVANGEFSDFNGNYNVTAEELAVEAAGMFFVNSPVNSAVAWSDTTSFFSTFVPQMDALETPVLVHCASGYRSSAYITTFLAFKANQCTSWALTEAAKIGFDFTVDPADQPIVQFMKQILKC